MDISVKKESITWDFLLAILTILAFNRMKTGLELPFSMPKLDLQTGPGWVSGPTSWVIGTAIPLADTLYNGQQNSYNLQIINPVYKFDMSTAEIA